MRNMIWTAWNNGAHAASGAGYGLKVPISDRDAHMKRSIRNISVIMPSSSGKSEVSFNIDKDSFWSSLCHELISKEFGQWLIQQELAPWPQHKPPRFEVEKIDARNYRIIGIETR